MTAIGDTATRTRVVQPEDIERFTDITGDRTPSDAPSIAVGEL